MRYNRNQYRNGQLQNGYDYDVRVWVSEGHIVDCGHDACGEDGFPCNAHRYVGERIAEVRKSLGL